MGNLLLGLAAGGKVVKLKSGHMSHNQPVRMTGSNKCCITTQNHSYAVDSESLGADWETSFVNMNDGSCEGIRHRSKPFSAVHFYPEAANGSTDMESLFSEFLNRL